MCFYCFPIQVITEYYSEFPVLYSKSLSVIFRYLVCIIILSLRSEIFELRKCISFVMLCFSKLFRRDSQSRCCFKKKSQGHLYDVIQSPAEPVALLYLPIMRKQVSPDEARHLWFPFLLRFLLSLCIFHTSTDFFFLSTFQRIHISLLSISTRAPHSPHNNK